MNVLLKLLFVLPISLAWSQSAQAHYCPRCAKIEEARAKEQAAHPQPIAYYDEFLAEKNEDRSHATDHPSNTPTQQGQDHHAEKNQPTFS